MKIRLMTATAVGTLALAVGLPMGTTAASAATSPRCTITGTAGPDKLIGTSKADVICGLGGNDLIIGYGGNDTLLGGPGNDRIFGGNGNDRIDGSSGADTLMGSTGNDNIVGGTQADIFVGGTGIDRLTAGTASTEGDTCAADAADPVTGICGTDTTGPEISDVNLPSVVNAGETLTFTYRVTDASGIDTEGAATIYGGYGPNTQAYLTGEPGFVYWCGWPLNVTRISGSSTDGVYQASCTVPAAAPNGTYGIQLSAADMFGNSLAGYSRSFDFEIQNGSNDHDAPSISYEGGLADSYRAGDDVTFTLHGTDETGVAGIAVFVMGPNGRFVDDNLLGWIDASETTLTSGTAQDGTYTVKIKLAATAVPGEYKFLLGFADTIGNRAWNQANYTGYPSLNVIP